MARKTFNVLFFIKKARLLKNGEAPACMRITVNGCMVDVLVKRSCPVNLWNQAKENSKGKDRMSVELNHYLEITRSRIHQIYRELESTGKTITVDLMRKLYYGVDEDSKTLLQVFREHNEQSRKLIGKDFVSKTVQRYETTTRYLEEFIKKEYQLSDIALNNLWKSHATLTLLATQDLPTFGYNMIDPLKSWCWGSILFYPFKISRFS